MPQFFATLPRDIKPIEVTSGVPNNFKLQSTEFLREESCHLEKKLDFEPFGEPFESHV